MAAEERLAPCSLTPTGLVASALPGESLGELRVEILQATGLERSDLYSQNDVYALPYISPTSPLHLPYISPISPPAGAQ